ncbi:MAG: EAL domain-containing protein [Nitriliruptoraceae bacterium]|nr:EAL domain-containing protein [Nitriliruptoraceae bacterium]
MSSCGTGACACRSGPGSAEGDLVVVRSATGHTIRALAEVAESVGAEANVIADGRILLLRGVAATSLVLQLDAALTTPERAEARAMLLPSDGVDPDTMLESALGARSLGELAAQLRYAHLAGLVEDEAAFRSRFQPIVDLHDRSVIGHEALLRAHTPDGDEVPAGDLFGAAAAGGWTNVLDRIGRETALRDASGWLDDQRLFINFVPTSVYRPEVCLATTTRAAKRFGIPLEQVVFEVVETHRTSDVGHLSTVVEHYRQRGARIALDDVGSGYSSLNLVATLRPDVVKIDMALIQALPDPSSAAVVRAIIDLSHGIGAEVVAEGIETEQQAEVVTRLGADLGQGWHFGRPVYREGAPSEHATAPVAGASMPGTAATGAHAPGAPASVLA